MNQIPTHSSCSRHLLHPGPISEVRLRSFRAASQQGSIRLRKGEVLVDEIALHLEPLGIKAAALDLSRLVLSPMQFVMPTYSKTQDHVAYYSETYVRDGLVRIQQGTATYGSRDGRPFLHGHVLWRDADDTQRGGHVLPYDCRIGEDCEIGYVGCAEIAMDARFDPETNFTLFAPYVESTPPPGDLIVAQIRPNEDLISSLERICTEHNIGSGRIVSLIGSTVGGCFDGGPVIDEVPTEILGLTGTIALDSDGMPALELQMALIDAVGTIHFGQPTRHENPVLICVEAFIQVLD
ncbi:PCC domain-containing protein [Shinella sp.]|uniref:PCC domain-containing protein n=1 Tax=Shinella sp. TaxID=1870904 RepID=UPI0028B163C6|nr:DUF296 domain-containing protein [Shinella sp.]